MGSSKNKKSDKNTHPALLLRIDEEPEELHSVSVPNICVHCGRRHQRFGRYCSNRCRDEWLSGAKVRSMRYNGDKK